MWKPLLQRLKNHVEQNSLFRVVEYSRKVVEYSHNWWRIIPKWGMNTNEYINLNIRI